MRRLSLDENGNYWIPSSFTPLETCYSYKTMEKEYEKDTLRMLERIQTSRAKEQESERDHKEMNTNTNTNTNTNDTPRDRHETDFFYIGDDHDEGNFASPRFAGWVDNNNGNGNGNDAPSLFEEDEQIFELDL